MKAEKFPLYVTEQGVSARIRKITQTKNAQCYVAYVVEYQLLGQRKREWRSDLKQAKQTAIEACQRIASGEQHVLELRNSDRLAYIRAVDALAAVKAPIDSACREYAEAVAILGGLGSVTEAARLLVKQRFGITQKSVPEAVKELLLQIETEQKNTVNAIRRKVSWLKLLRSHLQNKFAENFNCNVPDLTSALLESWLIGLTVSERTRSNIRDCVGFFLKWAQGRGYLAKEANLLANVQKFRKRKCGRIKIISADELARLLIQAPEDFDSYLALRAFAGLRDSEARALEWQHIDLAAGWIDVPEHVAKQTDDEQGVARMIKIRPVLKAWLQSRAKKSGIVCPYSNSAKKLANVAKAAGIKIPRNALRHTFISAAVTESSDLNAVSLEAGNSPTIIRQHYWQKMRPEQAAAWFAVYPQKSVSLASDSPASREITESQSGLMAAA